MHARTIAYWITTVLFSLALGASGLADLAHAQPLVDAFDALGYPGYLLTLLGGWKLLGVIAILAPGVPRLKEWAYAGFFFELSGGAFSHLASGVGSPTMTIVLAALGLASWALRADARLLGAFGWPQISTPRKTVDA
jgi:hypothetical protein